MAVAEAGLAAFFFFSLSHFVSRTVGHGQTEQAGRSCLLFHNLNAVSIAGVCFHGWGDHDVVNRVRHFVSGMKTVIQDGYSSKVHCYCHLHHQLPSLYIRCSTIKQNRFGSKKQMPDE